METLDLFSAQPPAPNCSVATIVKNLKSAGQDFEWYPTTDEILQCIKTDLLDYSESNDHPGMPKCSLLDVGAGDGRCLSALTIGPKFAIEMSEILIEQMPANVFVIGTNFYAQTLVDKRVDVIVTNPPYLDYENWSLKTVSEANASLLYLVIPKRWENSSCIKNAIEARRGVATVIGEFSFAEADRPARALVHVVRIDLRGKYKHGSSLGYSDGPTEEPFDIWFENEFLPHAKPDTSAAWLDRQEQAAEAEKIRASQSVVQAKGLMVMLSELYEREMKLLTDKYLAILSLPEDIVAELKIERYDVKKALRLKIEGLKAKYWKELFDRLDTITTRITSRHRTKLLDKLNSHTAVDFSVANATAIVLWVLKQANEYREPQLVELVETMTEKGNVQLYKTNQRTIMVDGWRHSKRIDIGPYRLDYQFILHDAGGLSSYGNQLIDDIVTVAATMGYDTYGNNKASENKTAGKCYQYFFMDETGNKQVLFEAKQFQNGNIHIKLNNRFLLKLNTAFGRLKGWLRSKDDVVQEMDVSPAEAAELFQPIEAIAYSNLPMLMLAA
jgi:hypothetical protein